MCRVPDHSEKSNYRMYDNMFTLYLENYYDLFFLNIFNIITGKKILLNNYFKNTHTVEH